MATTSVTSKYLKTEGHGKNSGKSAVEYVESERVHHADDTVTSRNLRRSSNCGDFGETYKLYSHRLKQEKGDRKTVAFFSIVQSFSKDELDYRSPEDVDLAHEAGCELARRLAKQYPDRAWGVWTQADGDSHHLHNHVYFMNYDSSLRAVPHKDVYRALDWQDVSELNDQVCEDILGKKSKPVRSPARQKLLEEGYSPLPSSGHKRKSQHKADIEHINEAFSQALQTAKSERELSLLLERQNVFIQIREDAEKDDQGHDLRWKTKSGRYRKALTLKHRGTKVRTDKLDKPLSTAEIVSKLAENANAAKDNVKDNVQRKAREQVQQENRQKQRKINVERTSERQPNAKPKPATRNVRGDSGYYEADKNDKYLGAIQETDVKPSSQQQLLHQIEIKLIELRGLKNKTEIQQRQEEELQQQFNKIQNEIFTQATQKSVAQLKMETETVWGD